jgi:hypothetical protein
MPITEKQFEKLITACGFLPQEEGSNLFLFHTENYQNIDGEGLISLIIERKKYGKMIHIHTVHFFIVPSSSLQAVFMTLSIITHHIPGLSFSYEPATGELRIQTCIFAPKKPPSPALLRIHVDLIIQTIDHYSEEITYAIENDELHNTFLPREIREKKIEEFQQLLEELQNLVNEQEVTHTDSDQDDPSDDIEWL